MASFFKLHALDARQMHSERRTAVRLSISFPRPVVHPPKGPPKDTGIRIEGSPREGEKRTARNMKIRRRIKIGALKQEGGGGGVAGAGVRPLEGRVAAKGVEWRRRD